LFYHRHTACSTGTWGPW